jgi:hypothetical protein
MSNRDYNTLHHRAASIAAMGGTGALGTFQRIDTAATITGSNHKRSYSVSAVDGRQQQQHEYLTPTEMGRQELYIEVPFTAVFGLQRKEHAVSQAFAQYAAHLEVDNQINLTPSEKKSRLSHASMILLNDIEFEANVVTIPLVFAVLVAAASQVQYKPNNRISLWFLIC